jgi:DNA-directed RNA polymerase I, II, and III subunit RPABC5
MIIPVKCFTCGNLLANKYLFYKKQVGLIKQAKNQENDEIQYLTKDVLDKSVEGEVLDMLNLTKPCCRRHMLTHVDIF